MATTLKFGMAIPAVILQSQDGTYRPLPDPGSPSLLVFYRGDW